MTGLAHLVSLALGLATSPSTAAEAPTEIAQAGSTQIELGAHVDGALEDTDGRLTSGEYFDVMTFSAQAGDQVRVTMTSTAFDTYFGVTGPGRFAVANDDSPGMGTNAQLILTLPETGAYRIQATSYRPGAVGAYRLSLDLMRRGDGAVAATAGAPAPLALGTDAQGTLEDGDERLRTGEAADTWAFEADAGARISVRLESDAFDPYLMIRGPGGLTRDNDDDAEGSLAAGIELTVPETGTVLVIATSYAPGERGAYTLVARETGRTPAVSMQRTLTPGQSAAGTLTSDDPARPGRQHYQVWTFDGIAGESVALSLRSGAFDTFLSLRHPNGDESSNDDISQRDTNSRLHLVLAASGTYEVIVSSYAAGAVGPYELALARDTLAEVTGDTDADTRGGSVAIGGRFNGRLSRRDAQLQSGEYYDTVTFEGTAGQGITVELESAQFDTYAMLRGPNGFTVDNDDGFAQGTNSRLEATLPESGSYALLVTSFAPDEVGRYAIRVAEGTRAQQNARGRIYAILAGITNYSDASLLPYCAEDAQKLSETLAGTGILADQSIVLTDDQVTRPNLERAFRSVASAAGPDDVVLFFYSGHGAAVASRSEFDGTDETLYLADGHLSDDDVAGWFDGLNARLSIIALDSCFSGGFARDVISRPNRMGIFSSEEDVTSNVAERFSAGGYLSYFLRSAFAGAADAEPADGILTAGELSQYLHRQWAQHNMAEQESTTAEAAGAYQNLVIDRGAVKVTDVVLYSAR